MGEALTSYAIDTDLANQDNNTNIDNVKFDVYFDESNKSNKEIEKDINSEDLKISVSVEVKNGGYLKNGQIEFKNCNFRLKNNTEKIELDSIQSGKSVEKTIEIFAKKDDLFDINLLNMVSQIKLTGEYVNNDGEKRDIDSTKNVKISWTADNITEENNPIKLNQEVITNKIYTVEGTNKRVIQLLVKSGIENNQYPIKSTEIELNAPLLGELYPEKVVVASYDTTATNGKDSTEFENINGIDEQTKLGKWTYNETEHKVNIEIENKPVENKVNWAKNGEDEFVVTYIYAENADLANFESNINNKISLYESKNTVLTTESRITKENMENMGHAITASMFGSDVIYKSNMNIGKDTEFETNWTIEVGYAEIAKAIGIANTVEQLVLDEEKIENATTYYKSTYINKAEFLKIFGEEGSLSFGYPVGEEIETIATINKESQVDENGDICINYNQNIATLLIITTNPISEGKLNIRNIKTLKTEEYDAEKIESINKLNSGILLEVYDNESNSIVEIDRTIQMNMQKPKTEVAVGIDKTQLSTTQLNENVNITATLKTDNLKYSLYKNPIIDIELPKEIENVELNSNAVVLNGNGLEFEKQEIVSGENENKIIRITLKGEQAEYIGQDVQITINTNLTATKLMPTITRYINVKCTNNEETAQNSCEVNFIAEQGMILANSISNYNNEEPEITVFKNETKTGLLKADSEEVVATGKATVINNTGDNLEDVIVMGKNTARITMENAEVYYTKDEEVTLDSNWVQEYSDDIKGYKIVLHSLEIGKIVEIPYTLKIPADLEAEQSIELGYIVYNGTIKLEESPKIVLETEKEVKLALGVEPLIANGEIVYEENILSYNIKITNIGDTIARNIQINNPVPEGTTIVDGYQSSWIVEELQAGKSVNKTIEIKVNTLAEDENEKTITNITTVTAPHLQDKLTSTIVNKIERTIVQINTKSNYGKIFYEGDKILHVVEITNPSDSLITNLTIRREIPDGTEYYLGGTEGVTEGVEYNWDADSKIATWKIEKLEANATVSLSLTTVATPLGDKEKQQLIYAFDIVNSNGKVNSFKKYEGDIVKPNLDIEFTSSELEQVKVGEEITYELNIKNNTDFETPIDMDIDIPEGLLTKSITTVQEDVRETESIDDNNKIILSKNLQGQKSLKIIITTEVTDSFSQTSELNAKATVIVKGRNNDGMQEEERIVFKKAVQSKVEVYIETETPIPGEPQNPENPNNPNNPNNPENPTQEEKTYNISGIAWLDKDEDGIKEENEELLKGILVKIKDAKTNEYLKDTVGSNLVATTNEKGEYSFQGLEKGQYIIEFEYNKTTYGLTKGTGSDSVANIVTVDGKTIITTDTLTIKDKDITNINIGLVLNPEFDLQLDKYITKITVQNSSGTKVYEYNKEQLAKVDIRAKQLVGSTVVIEYTIDVTNKGDVPGYAKAIVDYVSPELKFSSELNTSWYQGSDNNLYCAEFANEVIQPGETKQVKLVLTKTMTENNTGLVNNTAEIYEDFNEYALDDTNSTPGNKEEKENDMSSADVIITVSTGGVILYIGIIIGSMLVLGLGIYLINKKVIMRRVK